MQWTKKWEYKSRREVNQAETGERSAPFKVNVG